METNCDSYRTSHSSLFYPCLGISLPPFVVEPFFLRLPGLLALFLCLGALSCLVVGLHQPLLTLLLELLFVQLVIGDFEKRECRRLVFSLLLQVAHVLIPCLANGLVQLFDSLIQLTLVIKVVGFEHPLSFLLGDILKSNLQILVVRQFLLFLNELLEAHFRSLLL